jgi:hypothetical protein
MALWYKREGDLGLVASTVLAGMCVPKLVKNGLYSFAFLIS